LLHIQPDVGIGVYGLERLGLGRGATREHVCPDEIGLP
jgi:hypothetical protein